MRAVVLLVVLMCCAPALSWTNVTLPFVAYGCTGCRIEIRAESDLLVPSLGKVKATEDNLMAVVPFGETVVIGELLRQKELSLGSSQLYIYLAAVLAYDRIFQSLKFGRNHLRMEESAAASAIDPRKEFDDLQNTGRFRNTHALTKFQPLTGVLLKLFVYQTPKSFKAAAGRLGIHGGTGYWDPESGTIGILFDDKTLRWYRDWSGQVDESPTVSAIRVRDYVSRQMLGRLGHELAHFLQFRQGHTFKQSPFLAEAAALIVQGNLDLRDELVRIGSDSPESEKSDPKCATMASFTPPFVAESLVEFREGAEMALRPAFIERALSLSSASFNSQLPNELERQYALALTFGYFVTEVLSSREFDELIQPLMSSLTANRANRTQLAKRFQDWARQLTDGWKSKELQELYFDLANAVDRCEEAGALSSALRMTGAMYLLRPELPTAFIYAGDLFYKHGGAFYVFGYYALALDRQKATKGDASLEVQLLERLGDARAVVGDIQSALDEYSEVLKFKPAEIHYLLSTYYRVCLKLEFYRIANRNGYVRYVDATSLANNYASELHGKTCASAAQIARMQDGGAAIDTGDEAALQELWAQQFEEIRANMRGDMAETERRSLRDVVAAREARCAIRASLTP